MGKKRMKDVYNATITGGRGLDTLAKTFTRMGFNTHTSEDTNGRVTQVTISDYTTDMAHEVVGFFGIKGWLLGRELKVGVRRRVPV